VSERRKVERKLKHNLQGGGNKIHSVVLTASLAISTATGIVAARHQSTNVSCTVAQDNDAPCTAAAVLAA